jgi:hypothetical protein
MSIKILGAVLALSVLSQTAHSQVRRATKKGISFDEACKVMASSRQWMIGANKTGLLYPNRTNNGLASKDYNIKGLTRRKFLQYEKQGVFGGINIGWTNDASAGTATKSSKWYFSRPGASQKSLRYGEPIALAWRRGTDHYVKYGKKRVGINLSWSKKPSYEWAILGGKPGTSVKRGIDHVIIYNLKKKQPLIYFDRRVGGHIGWPNSKSWEKQAYNFLKKNVSMEDVIKVLMIAL